MSGWAWLTPAAPAAVGLLRCQAESRLFSRPLPEVGVARLVQLIDSSGQAIDEVVVLRVADAWLELGTHGGPGVRAAIEQALTDHGLQQRTLADDHWAQVARASSPAAVAWLLEHPEGQTPPFSATFLTRCPQVLITGPVNAGKSTLLNAWCGHQRALATPLPGTTRDLLTAEVVHAGWRLCLIDSAGIRQADDQVERAGIELARAARDWADVVIYLDPDDDSSGAVQADDVHVHGKCDQRRLPKGVLRWSAPAFIGEEAAHDLLAEIGNAVLSRLGLPDSVSRMT